MPICNLCRFQVDEAVPITGPGECPNCGLRPRHRAVGAVLQTHGDVTAEGRTLVCYASTAEKQRLFAHARDLTNFDIRPMDGMDLIMDIQDMAQIEDASQDVFVAIHVLHHVRDDRRALEEIARVLKPEGVLIVTVPVRDGAPTTETADQTVDYGAAALADYGVGTFRYYGLGDFELLLAREFDAQAISYMDPLTGEGQLVFLAQKHGEPAPDLAPAARDPDPVDARPAEAPQAEEIQAEPPRATLLAATAPETPFVSPVAVAAVAEVEDLRPEDRRRAAAYRAAELEQLMQIRGKRILDVGCGLGDLVQELAVAYGCEVVGIDTRAGETWDHLRAIAGVTLMEADISAGAGLLEPASFDGVVSIVAWEHMRHPWSALKTCQALLKDSGKIFLYSWLGRAANASHIDDLAGPWVHLLKSHAEIRRDHGFDTLPWYYGCNQVTYQQYLFYFRQLGFHVTYENLFNYDFDPKVYQDHEDVLELYPVWDLKTDAFQVVLEFDPETPRRPIVDPVYRLRSGPFVNGAPVADGVEAG